MNEEWRPIQGYDGYEVSSLGCVRSWRKLGARHAPPMSPRLKKQSTCVGGYLRVSLGREVKLVHRLVLEAFVGPAPEGMQCRHLNGTASDNRLVNLSWATPVDNNADKIAHGTHQAGTKNGRAKLSDSDVRAMRALRERGESFAKLGKKFGVSNQTAFGICKGKNWRHVG